MYQCPNCGGNIKYDITSSQMLCGHCATQMDPYSFEAGADAVENSYFDTLIYTCPQCAGELVCDDTEAAVFCPYCGGSTILEGRLNRAKRPADIIPFRKTKEECKEAYQKRMKWAWYAPSELKDEKYIDGFRGIYVPYWNYDVRFDGDFSVSGTKAYRRGDYIYSDAYDVKGTMNAKYKGHKDASAAFSDDMCERIEPFDMSEKKDFTPAFISGFYADIPDVEACVYRDEAKKMATKDAYKNITKTKKFRKLKIGEASIDNILKMQPTEVLLLPVWFMSYKKDNSILYTTINGQTGKVAADLPIDSKKYLIGTLLLAPVIFAILSLFVTLKPVTLVVTLVIMTLVMLWIYSFSVKKMKIKLGKLDDKGYVKTHFSAEEQEYLEMIQREEAEKKRLQKVFDTNFLLALCILGPVFVALAVLYPGLWGLVFVPIAAVQIFIIHRQLRKVDLEKKRKNYWVVLGAILVTCGILIWNPANALFFYIMAAVILFAMLLVILDMLFYHNALATRAIPQFDRQGGDDNA